MIPETAVEAEAAAVVDVLEAAAVMMTDDLVETLLVQEPIIDWLWKIYHLVHHGRI